MIIYPSNKAFTLAEVLITLLIIGVVASIILPNLINDTQRAENKVAWKKAFGVAANAYKLAVIDNGQSFGSYGLYATSLSPKWGAMKNYMSIAKSCHGNTLGNCWAKDGVTMQDGTYLSGGCSGFSLNNQNNTYAYVTSDGVFWLIFGDGAYTMDLMAVDINGAKGPNQFGKDVFTFTMEDSTVIKPGDTGSAGCGSYPVTVSYLK